MTKENKKEKLTKKNKTKKVTKPAKNKEKGFKKIKSWFHQVKLEVGKVTWPSKKNMIKYSIATIVFIIFFSLFFYLIEIIMAFLKSLV